MTTDPITISDTDKEEISKILGRFAAPKSDEDIFYDVCFAICAPQTTYEANKPCIDKLRKEDFYMKGIPGWILHEILTPVRFFAVKTDRVLIAKHIFPDILRVLRSDRSNHHKRMNLKTMVKGFGMKTTSHFLRNQGATDLAIIDTHILKFLNEDPNKSVSEKRYLILEAAFAEIADGMGVSTAMLDAYLWKVASGTDWKDFVY